MNAGKSLEIIKVANNYEELGKRVMCLVPEVDDRYERDMVTSRVGLSHKAYTVDDDTNIMTLFIEKNMRHPIDCVLVDECQFFRKHHVQELAETAGMRYVWGSTQLFLYGMILIGGRSKK